MKTEDYYYFPTMRLCDVRSWVVNNIRKENHCMDLFTVDGPWSTMESRYIPFTALPIYMQRNKKR